MTSVAAVNPAAHEEYLLGRYLLWKFVAEDRVRAIEHFRRAIQIDPAYAVPYAGLAHAWWMQGVWGPLSMKEAAPRARAAAERALELDDRLAEAYAAQAYVQGMFDWDWTRAEATLERASELDPNNLDARYVYALLLMALGRLPEATTQIEYAARLDPLSAQVHSTFGRILYRARRYDEAAIRLKRAVELEPRNSGAYNRLGNVYEQIGRYDEALALYQRREHDSEDVARVYARMGRVTEARQMLRRIENWPPNVYLALGDTEAAFAALFRSVDKSNSDSWPLYIMADPQYDSLRTDPRWNQLLTRMNLPAGGGLNAAH
jgi:tetratricopeptide (TPR) repeat protein